MIEPCSPWENPSEPKTGQILSMVKNFIIKFKVTLKEHDWVHKCYVDVTNKYS